jgi:2-polyprenyl-3-methyl-5-hydroxy-6-metoxy-1,4-benzoquinol methylase
MRGLNRLRRLKHRIYNRVAARRREFGRESVSLDESGLDEFVAESDRLGGPGTPACEAYWQDIKYQPSTQINTQLDPFGAAYAAAQMALYEELSGHPYRLEQDEQTAFDIDGHVAAINPYDHPDPAVMGVHLQRLARALSCAKATKGELLLDMGCGWGLSSEVAAYMGLQVIGVDINSKFVELVNRRAARTGYPIAATHGSFEGFAPERPVDLVLFYECLHHAVDPLAAVSRYAQALRPGGRMVLAGEPLNHIWWPHWGLRLDPFSIYCIRKFGWFESGWSQDHITEVMRRAGLVPIVHHHADPVVGPAIIGEKPL